MTLLLAILVLLTPATALAADDGGAALGGTLGACATALGAVVVAVVQTRRANAARAATASGDRDAAIGARQVALDAAVLHARAKAARAAGAEAALALVAALEAEASRAECASCTTLRAELATAREELAVEREQARVELRTNLERVLPALADAVAAVRESSEMIRSLVATMRGEAP